MSYIVQISYEHDRELLTIMQRLEDLPLKVSKRPYQNGQFKRVYLRGEDAPPSDAGKEKPNWIH